MKKEQQEEKTDSLFQKLTMTLMIFIGAFPLFYFLSVEVGTVQASGDTTDLVMSDPLSFDRYVENNSFGVGEKFDFDINYGFVNAGTATMEVVRLIEWEHRPCYQIVTHANSNSFFSKIYPVKDKVESIFDALGLYPWRFEKVLSEGSYRSTRQYDLDQRNNLVYYNEDTTAVAPFVQDALSILYWIRCQPLKVGESQIVESYVDGKKYSVKVNVLKRETIEVDAGKFDCLVVEPLTSAVGVFRHNGKLKVWLTDDNLKMPVMMKAKVIVGSISVELTDFRLGEMAEL